MEEVQARGRLPLRLACSPLTRLNHFRITSPPAVPHTTQHSQHAYPHPCMLSLVMKLGALTEKLLKPPAHDLAASCAQGNQHPCPNICMASTVILRNMSRLHVYHLTPRRAQHTSVSNHINMFAWFLLQLLGMRIEEMRWQQV